MRQLGRTSSGSVVFLSCAAQFMVVLDVSVVNVALPTVQAGLGFDALSVPWVVNAYTLTFAGFLLLGGRLADLYGLRRVLLAGLAAFAGASLVGGLASTPALLVGARAVQGLGAAVLAPVTLTLLTTTVPEGRRRTRAIAAWTAVGLAGGSAGNLLGGVLTETLSWRWVLLINVPLGAAAMLAAWRRLPRSTRARDRAQLDLPGAITAVLGLTALTWGIIGIGDRGWSAPTTWLALLVALAALIGFLVLEARPIPAPLIPLEVLRVPAVTLGNVIMVLAGGCFMPMWFFLAFLMHDHLHFSPLQTGLGFLPHTVVTMVVGMWVAPRVMQHLPIRIVIVLGALVAAAGFTWQAVTAFAAHDSYLQVVLGPAVLMSIGGGLLNTPLTTTVTSGVPAAVAGAASGLMNTTKQVGGALGLAALAALATGSNGTAAGMELGPPFVAIAMVLIVVAVLAPALPARRDAAEPAS